MTRDASFFRPLSGSELPRFAGRSTFMRLPQIEDPAEVDIALVGRPRDSGSTNRAGHRRALDCHGAWRRLAVTRGRATYPCTRRTAIHTRETCYSSIVSQQA